MWSVPSELRPFALSLAEVSQHLLGDIPSPPLIGALQSRLGNWRVSMSACTCLLAGSAAIFLAALLNSRGCADYRELLTPPGDEDGGGERAQGGDAEAPGGALAEPLLPPRA
jgi:hypothetical protein